MAQLDDPLRIETPDGRADRREVQSETTPEVAMLLQRAPESIRSSIMNGASGITSNMQNKGAVERPTPSETDIVMLLDLMPRGSDQMAQ